MPGIAGIISKHIVGDESDKLGIMVKAMNHESFYHSGTAVYRKPEICIGHISIKDSFSDCMPIYNETKDLVLFLVGECFVDEDVIASLQNRGHEFNPGNASFLIHLFEEQGEQFFSKLNGWFSGIILDQKDESIFLFNDRYGKRRIYYHTADEAFYFSSEAKSLLKIFPSLRSIDYKSMGEYLSYDCVLNNRTYFSGISLLPPGSVWSFRNGDIRKRLHYDQEKLENQPKLSENRFYQELSDTFERVLPRYFSGKSQMLALTGGLDTRMILACRGPKPGELPCYSHAGIYNEMLDVRIAQKVAKACSQTHRKVRLDKEFLNHFSDHIQNSMYITDGLTNACQGHILYCNKASRHIAPIRITGKFGSQVLKMISGFHRPTGYDADERLTSEDFKQYVSIGKDTFFDIIEGHPLSVMLFKELPWWWSGNSTAEFSQLTVRSPYLDNDFVDLLYRSPFSSIDVVSFQMGLIRKKDPELATIMTDKGYGGSPWRLISIPQKMVYQWMYFVEKVYSRDKLPCSLQHWVARMDSLLLSPLHINNLFLGLTDYRHYRIWFRDELSGYIKEVLLDDRTLNRPYWNRRFLEKAVNDHTRGYRNHLPEIRKALSIELIHRVLIEDI